MTLFNPVNQVWNHKDFIYASPDSLYTVAPRNYFQKFCDLGKDTLSPVLEKVSSVAESVILNISPETPHPTKILRHNIQLLLTKVEKHNKRVANTHPWIRWLFSMKYVDPLKALNAAEFLKAWEQFSLKANHPDSTANTVFENILKLRSLCTNPQLIASANKIYWELEIKDCRKAIDFITKELLSFKEDIQNLNCQSSFQPYYTKQRELENNLHRLRSEAKRLGIEMPDFSKLINEITDTISLKETTKP